MRGKVVLDLPCGMGVYVRKFFKLGAAKVIASDIVGSQLEFSAKKDEEVGIPKGFVEYRQHDARIPQQLSSELADVVCAIHLFCFAENEADLRGMVRTILTNLKRGGCCISVACFLSPAYDEQTIRSELERFGFIVKHLDPPSSEKFKPRRRAYTHTHMDFCFDIHCWSPEVIRETMIEEGFSKVEFVPYKIDPSYTGDVDLQPYIDVTDSKIILAWN